MKPTIEEVGDRVGEVLTHFPEAVVIAFLPEEARDDRLLHAIERRFNAYVLTQPARILVSTSHATSKETLSKLGQQFADHDREVVMREFALTLMRKIYAEPTSPKPMTTAETLAAGE